MRAIVVTRRSGDWMAAVEGEPSMWGCGGSIQAAIGDLIMTWGQPSA